MSYMDHLTWTDRCIDNESNNKSQFQEVLTQLQYRTPVDGLLIDKWCL